MDTEMALNTEIP